MALIVLDGMGIDEGPGQADCGDTAGELAAAGFNRTVIGKPDDLFAGRAVARIHPLNNSEAYDPVAEKLDGGDPHSCSRTLHSSTRLGAPK